MGVRVSRHVTDEGSWELVSGDPAPPLAGHVRTYAGYHERTAAPARRRELPGPIVPFILELGEPLRLYDPDGRLQGQHPGGFVAGLGDTFTTTESESGEQRGIQVDFSLTAARALLGVGMHELAGRLVRIDDLFGRAGRELRARIEETSDWSARFALLDRFFLARVDHAPPDWLSWAWQRIEATGGLLSIDALARELGYSRKHVAVSFRERFGMAPKPLAQLVRFERAVKLLRSPRRPPLAEIAVACGYFDQAHFIREFRRYAGSTPGEYSMPWPVDEVTSVQDPAARAP